jgi:hypothetical protein
MTPVHLAVVDAYAEHFNEDRPRSTFVAPDRLEWWTRYKRTATNTARRELVAWGWLEVTAPAARGRSARYALSIPNGGRQSTPITGVAGIVGGRQTTHNRPNGGRQTTPNPLPRTPSTNPEPTTAHEPPTRPQPAGARAGGGRPSPKGTQAAAEALGDVLAPAVRRLPKVTAARPALAAALAPILAAGWRPAEVREVVAGAEDGARDVVAVILSRLRSLHGLEAPHAVAERERQARAAAHRLELEQRAARRAAEDGAPRTAPPPDFRARIEAARLERAGGVAG